ncbi:MAG: NifB/NifX family molybdenum-iron cluster-binding protein [Methermicoccaceae archaeon]
MNMRIGIPTEGKVVCAHFGHSESYTLVDVDENGNVMRMTRIDSPGHRPNFLPTWLKEHGVDVVISGGMGPKAMALFASLGIEPVVGASGTVESVVRDFLSGRLSTDANMCDHLHTHYEVE